MIALHPVAHNTTESLDLLDAVRDLHLPDAFADIAAGHHLPQVVRTTNAVRALQPRSAGRRSVCDDSAADSSHFTARTRRPARCFRVTEGLLQMKPLLDTIEFLHAMRSQMRFGEFSRLPIKVHRFQVQGSSAECDWFMRPPDPWHVHLSQRLQQEHRTQQALHDALKIRELIFRGFPQVDRAGLRMYRALEGAEPELMLIGEVERETGGLGRVASLVLRAQLYGFRFSLTGGALERIPPKELNPGF